jgi:hypothetical protein
MKKQLLVLALSSISASVFAAGPATTGPATPIAVTSAVNINQINNALNAIGTSWGYGPSGTYSSSSGLAKNDSFGSASANVIKNLALNTPKTSFTAINFKDTISSDNVHNFANEGSFGNMSVSQDQLGLKSVDKYNNAVSDYKTTAANYVVNSVTYGANGINNLINMVNGNGDLYTFQGAWGQFAHSDPTTSIGVAVKAFNNDITFVNYQNGALTNLDTVAKDMTNLVSSANTLSSYTQLADAAMKVTNANANVVVNAITKFSPVNNYDPTAQNTNYGGTQNYAAIESPSGLSYISHIGANKSYFTDSN